MTVIGYAPRRHIAGLSRPNGNHDDAFGADDSSTAETPILIPLLTPRECDVLLSWLTSDSKTVVSEALGLSHSTIKTHLHRIRGKYEAVGRNASTKAALVARALQDGLIRLEDL